MVKKKKIVANDQIDLFGQVQISDETPDAFKTSVKQMRGNRGEWSEVYVFLRLLADGFLADKFKDDQKKDQERRKSIVNVIRQHPLPVLYHLPSPSDGRFKKDYVYISKGDGDGGFEPSPSVMIPRSEFIAACVELERVLADQKGEAGTFGLPESHTTMQLIRKLEWSSLKAPSDVKADLKITIAPDMKRASEVTNTYSIKSALGGAATLFNADKASNFDYKIIPIKDGGAEFNQQDAEELNKIDSRQKIKERMQWLADHGFRLEYREVKSPVFSDNLKSSGNGQDIDVLLQSMLLKYFHAEGAEKRLVKIGDFIPVLAEDDPLKLRPKYKNEDKVEGAYKQVMKTLLAHMALGMTSGKQFDPEQVRDDVSGGMLVLKEEASGKPSLCAHSLLHLNQLENYLLENTRLETGSTTRHNFAQAYLDEASNEWRMALNLQIRFVEEKMQKPVKMATPIQARMF